MAGKERNQKPVDLVGNQSTVASGATEQYYQHRAAKIDFHKDQAKAQRLADLIETVFPEIKQSGLRILDAGSGVGSLTLELAKRYPNSKLVGLEINQQEIEAARHHLKHAPQPNVEFVQGDVCTLPFPDQAFDIILSNQVIEHVPNDGRLIQEAYRVLRPGGRLFIATATRLFPWEFHLKMPFIPWLPKFMAIRLLAAIGQRRASAYYHFVFPVTTFQIERQLRQQGFTYKYRGQRWLNQARHISQQYSLPGAAWLRRGAMIAFRIPIISQVTKHFFPYTCYIGNK